MADSDGEDEKFVKNVMHELSAFQVKEKPASIRIEETKSTEQTSATKLDDNPTSNETEPPKPPTRIIKLSRPLNPYGSGRTAQGLSISTAQSSGTAGTQGANVPSQGAPGSRLAALQRPGSPMQRFLQRSKSPALAAAAARLGQSQPAEHTSSQGNHKANSDPDTAAEAGSKEAVEGDSGPQTSLRSSLPSRIQTSGLTSSILLRRPQSPLRSSRTALINRQSLDSALDDGPTSPKSPPSDGSANLSSTGPTNEEAQNAEKEAIRNKLRANSFRLKDLLTKRPFVKPREQGEGEGRDDGQTDQSAESSDGQSGSSTDGGRTRDRTRWRTEGTGSSVSQRSRQTERTTSILSSRESYARTRNLKSLSDELDKNSVSGSNLNSGARNGENCNDIHQAETLSQTAQRTPENENVTVAATLLRSPRTKVVSTDSNVPSKSDDLRHESTGNSVENPEKLTLEADSSENRSKMISKLEKDSEANLVFDSENIGQSNNTSPEEDTSSGSQPSDMTRSLYAGSQSQERSSGRPRVCSEPATPITEQHPLINSQSYEKSLDSDTLRDSPSLKRSFAVTDLDKAMQERDKQKLSSIFRESSQDQGEEKRDRHETGRARGKSTMDIKVLVENYSNFFTNVKELD